jgi:hypothetical protein
MGKGELVVILNIERMCAANREWNCFLLSVEYMTEQHKFWTSQNLKNWEGEISEQNKMGDYIREEETISIHYNKVKFLVLRKFSS